MPPLEIFFMTNVDFVLIDDSPLDIFIAQNIIDRLGFQGQVWSFENGKEALDFLSAQPRPNPTLIFVDIQMPTMDGFAFLEAFEGLGLRFRQHCDLFMLSSSINERDVQRAKSFAQVRAFLEKPLDMDGLRDCLHRFGFMKH